MRRNIIIAGGAAIALILLFWFVLINPKMADVRAVEKKVEEAERREASLRNTLRQLEEARRNTAATQARLAKFQLLLPATPDLPTFIRQVQGAANSDGIKLESIAPGPPAPLGGSSGAPSGIQEIGVTLRVVGGFFRMESFLARLEDLQRVVEIRSVSLSPTADALTGEFTLQGTIGLAMYVVEPGAKAPATRPAPAPAASPTASPSPTTSPSPTMSPSPGGTP